MFSFYKLVSIMEKIEELEEDKWVQSAGINPQNKYVQQWRTKVQDAARLRQKERVGKGNKFGPLSRDSFSNAQSSKRVARSTVASH